MRFTEENLKNLKLTKNGNFRNSIRKITYYYHYACGECGYPFIGEKDGKYCEHACANWGENNHMFGRTGELAPGYGRIGDKHPMFGKKAPNNKVDVVFNNIPLYYTYVHQLEPFEQCYRELDNLDILNVECFHCGVQFRPTRTEVRSRIYGITNNDTNKFYCSPECKENCIIFSQKKYPKGHKPYEESRSHQHELKIITYNRDKGLCQICGIEVTLETSICHHEVPVAINGIISLDYDNVWTLCIDCDNHVHKLPGCSAGNIRKRAEKCTNKIKGTNSEYKRIER